MSFKMFFPSVIEGQPHPQANSGFASERRRLGTERVCARRAIRIFLPSSSGDVLFDPAPRTTGNGDD